ncbi:GNAT family N-acetyltransferase [Halosolutus gelatinilyticus]|uniref:GNAT family N-acetyltransferase n=1 Tax=Halosolutus gelatinilyticus TaxID=2931975 RepID=UPI001FF2BA5D|nr:GNAT family N-acetyltransferase [Halosolutus gelatinilyticus]
MTRIRELRPADAPALTALYEEYAWWDDRDVDAVRKALTETEVAVGVEDDGDLVAGARVLTDYRYYATVYDVLVAADRRGEGFGERLLNAVVSRSDLETVPGLSLLCHEGLVLFYESIGFEPFGPEFEIPEGGTAELLRMTYERADESPASE